MDAALVHLLIKAFQRSGTNIRPLKGERFRDGVTEEPRLDRLYLWYITNEDNSSRLVEMSLKEAEEMRVRSIAGDRKTIACIIEAMTRAETAQIRPLGQRRFRDCFSRYKDKEYFWFEKPVSVGSDRYTSCLLEVSEVAFKGSEE